MEPTSTLRSASCYCEAYALISLVLISLIQAPYNLRCTFRAEILDATDQAAELLRHLAKDINNMKHNVQTSLLKRVHGSSERLQRSVDVHSYLFTLRGHQDAPLSKLPSCRLSNTFSFNNNDDDDDDSKKKSEEGNAVQTDQSSYHETMRRQQRRLHSWPSREVDGFEEEAGADSIPRMRALESTTALSLVTFTSLLIEFVARLDHLVEAVAELAKLANFRQDMAC